MREEDETIFKVAALVYVCKKAKHVRNRNLYFCMLKGIEHAPACECVSVSVNMRLRVSMLVCLGQTGMRKVKVTACAWAWGTQGSELSESQLVHRGVGHTGKRIVRVAACASRRTDGESIKSDALFHNAESGSGLAGLLGCGCSSSCRRELLSRLRHVRGSRFYPSVHAR